MFVLALEFTMHSFTQLWIIHQDWCEGQEQNYFDIANYRQVKRYLCFQESEIIIQSIITFHAFTRCDTTSAFWRKGKVRPLHLMLKNPEFTMRFAGLGNIWEIDEISLLSKIEVFVCAMYGCTSCNSVNKLRYASILQF